MNYVKEADLILPSIRKDAGSATLRGFQNTSRLKSDIW